jgi:hypothetical protein
MVNFNFNEHFLKLGEATDWLAKSYVKREWFMYYDSLSKEEQQEFKKSFDEYLHNKSVYFKEQIAIGKQMMIEAGIPIS